MANIYDWISRNYEWVFSGLGVLVVGGLVRFLSGRKRRGGKLQQKQTSGDGSLNIQAGRDVTFSARSSDKDAG